MKKYLLFSAIFFSFLVFTPSVNAQEDSQSGPVYIVEEGDTLSSIALQFGITVEDLVVANGLPDANSLFVGDRLTIPGLPGISGRLVTDSVPFGENLRSLSRKNQVPLDQLIKLNRLVSPAELHRGASLVLTRSGALESPFRISMPAGQTLLETAVRHNENPWKISNWNGVVNTVRIVPSDVILLDKPGDEGPMGLPGTITGTSINTMYQGEAAAFRFATTGPVKIKGNFGPYNFAFHQASEKLMVALQGINTLLEPGMYPVYISAEQHDGSTFDFVQSIRILPREHIFEYINIPPELIDPETTENEFEVIKPYLISVSQEKLWDGLFAEPSPFSDCINSTFGNRRSYNGSAFIYYHSGVDYCGGTGVEIYAPAKGVVVFTALLDIRGNFTLIDHGWGVLTAYMHQSEIFVSEGDVVNTGDRIGLVGNTGRSTGPHLHWEIWVNGVPVNPLDWLVETYP